MGPEKRRHVVRVQLLGRDKAKFHLVAVLGVGRQRSIGPDLRHAAELKSPLRTVKHEINSGQALGENGCPGFPHTGNHQVHDVLVVP